MSEHLEVANPLRTKAIMERYGLHAKKSLGQNFLTDLNVLKNIVSAAKITKQDNVIEIGPGIGALTEQLALAANQVVALELDDNLIRVLDEVLIGYSNVKIINQDVLKANLPQIVAEKFDDNSRPVKVVANLPYYITTPILMQLLSSTVKWDSIVVMMQKEVAQRLAAVPGTKAYGSLSLAVQYQMDTHVAFDVSRKVFIPSPNVDSAIVVLEPRQQELVVKPFDERSLFRLIKGCFSHRRKSLYNNLQAVFGKAPEIRAQINSVLTKINIDAQIRPEQLSLEQFIQLTNAFHTQKLI
ncbi:16S rRNA (adenine(1518)-N(6)/adenine(1519)-N(6))-dimethyltransferase RsmA [Paucilactobacillus wasatchensis]|uniref:Ribosomal RNA small subunit methyltransferase A n=1 Tax=Paucilactobacillus wasatchensis TaxID=1335616 RepID=A0A0D0YY73_9LACO|nr:16S rRNA (adenine(1518)-N(6)/adenine(1519)-N(6))-dimethyltransferase RsmA [Paucilactobacillus wasatchensis]KIS04149.1 Dimethyladenosine transferase [Paucilactobacillus wasatchensis]